MMYWYCCFYLFCGKTYSMRHAFIVFDQTLYGQCRVALRVEAHTGMTLLL